MIPKFCSIIYSTENAKYPRLVVKWERHEDELGATGSVTVYKAAGEREERTYKITIRQTLPIGEIFFELDGCIGGSWASGAFEGTGLTERDLQWATAWAALAIKDKKARLYGE